MPNYHGTRLMSDQSWSITYPGHIAIGAGEYRMPFQFQGRRANRYKVEVACTKCGTLFLQDRANHRKGNKPFCAAVCKSAYSKARSRGRTIVKKREHGEGFHVQVYQHDHPRADKTGKVFQHILVAEKMLGRGIEAYEKVHHINCVKNDNRPENLFVCASTAEHQRIHGSLNKCVELLLQSRAIIFDEERKEYRVACASSE